MILLEWLAQKIHIYYGIHIFEADVYEKAYIVDPMIIFYVPNKYLNQGFVNLLGVDEKKKLVMNIVMGKYLCPYERQNNEFIKKFVMMLLQ